MVPESGEDSEDEWNYINVKREDTGIASASDDVAAATLHPTHQFDDSDTDQPQLGNEREHADEQLIAAESHAVLQALVEPQEDFAEVSVEDGKRQHG